MDVRVYPPPPQSLSATDPSRLGLLQYTDTPYGNKVRHVWENRKVIKQMSVF